MKRVFMISFLFVVLIINLNAQETVNNFLPENNKIFWQKVYETGMDFNHLVGRVKESGILVKYEIEDNKILGQTKQIEADYKGAGYGEMSTPMYVARSFFNGFAVIEFKNGKYRVIIKNIMLTQKYDDGLSKEGEKSTIESFGIKKGKNEMKAAFMKSPSKILDYTFTKAFVFKLSDKKGNW